MLRSLVIALLAANVVFWTWSHGWLDGLVGVKAIGDREPERLARQVNPQSVIVLRANAQAVACVETAAINAEDGDEMVAELARAFPGIGFAVVRSERPAAWLVYVGRLYTEQVARRREEIQRTQVPFEEVKSPPELVPGFSFGRFEDRAAADTALAEVSQRGVRNARVVQATPPGSVIRYRLEGASSDLATRLLAWKPSAPGRAFAACAAH